MQDSLAATFWGVMRSFGFGSVLRADAPNRAEPVAMQIGLPREAEVVVIGAGIAGLSLALHLKDLGYDVLVLEKGAIAGEQSSRAFGWVYSNGFHPDKLALAQRSKELWHAYQQRFGDIGYRVCGNATVISTPEEEAACKEWLIATEGRTKARLLTPAEIADLYPQMSPLPLGVLYQDDDGMIAPRHTVPRLAAGMIADGLRVVGPCAVLGMRREGNAITGVETERGYVAAKHVVVAGGVWSSKLLASAGVVMPQLALSTSLQRLRVADAPEGTGYAPDYTWRREEEGTVVLGGLRHIAPVSPASLRHMIAFLPTLRLPEARAMLKIRLGRDFFRLIGRSAYWRYRTLAGDVDTKENAVIRQAAEMALTGFGDAKIVEEWAGVIEATPDSTPVISATVQNGLWVLTGFCGNGLSMAPAAGEMLAQMIHGSADGDANFALSRFKDSDYFNYRH